MGLFFVIADIDKGVNWVDKTAARAVYHGKDFVALNPDFEAETGSKFAAYVLQVVTAQHRIKLRLSK